MSTNAHMDRKTGDIEFPLWVKLLGGILSVCTPLGLTLVGWLTVAVVRIETRLDIATGDRYTGTEHALFADAQRERDLRQNDRIAELERLAGRGPNAHNGN